MSAGMSQTRLEPGERGNVQVESRSKERGMEVREKEEGG